VPSRATLTGFTEISGATEGVDLGNLSARDRIHLRTDNSDYRIILTDPRTCRVVVQGGRLFVEPTEAIIRGSTCGGAMLRTGWIGIGLQLELACILAEDPLKNVVTSPVQSLFVERGPK